MADSEFGRTEEVGGNIVPAPSREDTISGYIAPRLSWPRPATPTDLAPAWAGEFRDFADWVSKATNRLTGTYDPLTGAEIPAICIDAAGRRCTMGAHMMRARDEGTFPVRFFWDCAPVRSDDGNTAVNGRRASSNLPEAIVSHSASQPPVKGEGHE